MRITGLNSIKTYDLYLNAGYAAAGVVLLFLFFAAVILPIRRDTQRIAAETEQYKELIQSTSQMTVERQRLERQLASKEQSLSELQMRIPAAPLEAEFLAQVCELAHRLGMEITDYHPGTAHPRETYRELEVKVSCRGDYAAVCEFLHQSEEIPRLCRLVHFEMNALEADQPLTCDFTYRIFFIPPAEADAPPQGNPS